MDDDRPMVGGELAEGSAHLISIGQRAARVRRGSVVVGKQPDVRALATLSPRLVVAGVHEQTTQPGVEPMRIAQRPQVGPGADERVLHGILRAAAIAQDEGGGREQPVDAGCGQCREGLAIASAGRADHGLDVQGLLSPRMASVQGMANRRGPGFTPK